MSAFPPRLPADLDDPSSIFENDWAAFSQLDAMQNHWDRPGWTPGRRSYHWLVTFAEVLELQRLAATCQQHLRSPTLDPVPLDGLHVTLGRLAFTDEIQRRRVDEVLDAAGAVCADVAPFDLTIGPLAGSTGALRFSLAPWPSLLGVQRKLVSVSRRVLGDGTTMASDSFRPHVSIAYSNASRPVWTLLPVVGRLRALPLVAVSISSISLVELRREERTYRFREIGVVGLGR